MPFDKNPDEIGALWVKSSAKGDYMTGEINGEKVVCFARNSTNPKAPTWTVLKSKPRGEATERPMHNANAPHQADDSDIPF